MKFGSFEFDIEGAKKRLSELGIKTIMLQIPDGLKRKAVEISDQFERDTILWGGTCYGACDLPLDIGGAEALLHFGHSEIPNLETDYPVIYLEGRNTEWRGVPDSLFDELEGEVALYATVQHLDDMKRTEEKLSAQGFHVDIGEGSERIKYPGQVIGCNYSTRVKDAETHLFIGTGRFHQLGLSLSLGDDIVKFNPVSGDVSVMSDISDDLLRKRFAKIVDAEKAETIGIFLSSKVGQRRVGLAEELNSSCERCTIFEFDEIYPELVDDLGLDCAVNTACPRIALDDSLNFDTNIITTKEYEITKDLSNWVEWEFDEIY